MTDLSKQLLEKAHGGLKINPDEQRRYLGTFEERVLGYVDIDTANSPQLEKGFLFIWLFVNCSGLKSAKLEKGQILSFLF